MMLVKCPAIDFDTMQARIAESDGRKNCSDILVDFYKGLGWTPETHEIDPVCVKMNPADQLAFCENMSRLTTPEINAIQINIMFLMKGPSSDEHVPQGRVWLQNGWIIKRPGSSLTA